MMLPVTGFPHWSEFAALLREGRSGISYAPRYSLQPSMFQYLRGSYGELGADYFVPLQPDESVLGGHVDWQQCATMFFRQLGGEQPDCPDAGAFRKSLLEWTELHPGKRLLVAVGIGAPSSAEGRFELVSALDRCLDSARNGSLSIAVFDDYSLYYYEWWRTQGVSRWDYLDRLHLRSLDRDDIEEVLRRELSDVDDDARITMADEIERITGGHIGLAAEAIANLAGRAGALPANYWKKDLPRLLSASHAIDAIRRSLQEDTIGLTGRALEYEQPKPARDYNSPTVQVLRSLGILQWTTFASARLCPGIIRDVVKEIRRRAEDDHVVGTVLRDAGENLYVPKTLAISDDDITILHISDVHAGEPYAFRMNGDGRHDRPSAANMLADDLKASNITHVDAVVLSGDFTQTADIAEFRRAKEVLTELLKAIGTSWEAAIIVAGNHDIRWHPSNIAVVNPLTSASREEFATFRELVGKGADTSVDVHLVVSRSKRRAIRVIALDSNLVEGPDAGGIGYVSLETLQSVQSALAALHIPESVEHVSTWAVVHHHVFPVTAAFVADARNRRVSVMGNAASLLSFAVGWDVEMMLHGHEHQPCLTVGRRWPIERGHDLAPFCVAGAGSFGCKREFLGPFARNHYFIHVRRQNDILIRSRMTGAEGLGWVAHGDLSIPVSGPTPKAHPAD